MTKTKYFVMIFVMVILLLIMPNMVNAAVTYTREIPSNDGTITLNLSGLTLNDSTPYSYALVTKGGTPTTWHTLTEYTTTTAKVPLSVSTTDLKDVLKVTDTGLLYIKDDSTNKYVVNGLSVNLKLPYLQAISYIKEDTFYNLANHLLYGEIGNEYLYIGDVHTYSKWQKITDTDFVKKFLDVKNNGKEITSLESSLPVLPTTGYTNDRKPQYSNKNDGLYILWVKLTGENCKDVYGAIIHDGLPEATKIEQYIQGLDVEAPTVNSIAVTSPESGTYKTKQTVKITVTFSEEITGTTVPTLKIKFGESAERSVTNGTISGKTIVYTYNIQDTDKGQLAVTGYAGGTIKDAAGNDAKITLKTISGNTIKANVDGTVTNDTDNQDKNNANNNTVKDNNTTTDNTNKNNNTNTQKPNTNNNQSIENKIDSTVANVKIPQTGIGIGLTCLIISVVFVAVIVYFKYNNLKDI